MERSTARALRGCIHCPQLENNCFHDLTDLPSQWESPTNTAQSKRAVSIRDQSAGRPTARQGSLASTFMSTRHPVQVNGM